MCSQMITWMMLVFCNLRSLQLLLLIKVAAAENVSVMFYMPAKAPVNPME